MTTEDELREVSKIAGNLLTVLFETCNAALLCQTRNGKQRYARRFAEALCQVEEHTLELAKALKPKGADEVFAAVSPGPVRTQSWHPSAHAALLHEGENVGQIAWALVEAANPGFLQPGTERHVPKLPSDGDILRNIDVALDIYRQAFSPLDCLNRIGALLQQELSRAIQNATSARSTTKTKRSRKRDNQRVKRAQLCYELSKDENNTWRHIQDTANSEFPSLPSWESEAGSAASKAARVYACQNNQKSIPKRKQGRPVKNGKSES